MSKNNLDKVLMWLSILLVWILATATSIYWYAETLEGGPRHVSTIVIVVAIFNSFVISMGWKGYLSPIYSGAIRLMTWKEEKKGVVLNAAFSSIVVFNMVYWLILYVQTTIESGWVYASVYLLMIHTLYMVFRISIYFDTLSKRTRLFYNISFPVLYFGYFLGMVAMISLGWSNLTIFTFWAVFVSGVFYSMEKKIIPALNRDTD